MRSFEKIPAKFIASYEINGHEVGFFTPPHREVDLFWVDALALCEAYLPAEASETLLRYVFRDKRGGAGAMTAHHDDRVVTIVCHPIAQGMASAIDVINGDQPEDGPAYNAYCKAAAKVHYQSRKMPFPIMLAALENAGGPILRAAEEERKSVC